MTIKMEDMTPIRRLCKALEMEQGSEVTAARLEALVKEYLNTPTPSMVEVRDTKKNINMISVVVNGKRNEVNHKTYLLTEDLIPTLLQRVPEETLMAFATYVEFSNTSPFMVAVQKNRINGSSVRESISELLENGIPPRVETNEDEEDAWSGDEWGIAR